MLDNHIIYNNTVINADSLPEVVRHMVKNKIMKRYGCTYKLPLPELHINGVNVIIGLPMPKKDESFEAYIAKARQLLTPNLEKKLSILLCKQFVFNNPVIA